MTIRVLRPREAQQKLSVGNSHFYELVRTDPSFPRPVILGRNARGYIESELDAWVESKRQQRVSAA